MGLEGLGFHPFSSRRHETPENDSDNAVDVDALTDPGHSGHRDAVRTIAHVDDEKRQKIAAWIKAEVAKLDGAPK